MSTAMRRLLRESYYAVSDTARLPGDIYRFAKGLTPAERAFAERLHAFTSRPGPARGGATILVQMTRDYEYAVKLAAASRALAEKEGLGVACYEVEIPWIRSSRKLAPIRERLNSRCLEMVHLAFCREVAFRNSAKHRDQGLIARELEATMAKIEDPTGLLAVEFEGVLVGDLLYDTYIRFFHRPTIDRVDRDVRHVVEVGLNVFHAFKEYLDTHNVRYLLNTYSTYIHHGIPARLCLERGIAVFTLGSSSYVAQRMTPEFPHCQINHGLFDPAKPLTRQQLDKAQAILSSRFAGHIDPAIGYMKFSPYRNVPLAADVRKLFAARPRNVVIFVHDFFDCSHIDRLLQFPDLYRFLEQTLAALADLEGTSVFVKTHPNGVQGSKEKTIEMVAKLGRPHFHVLDESVSNLGIIELRPDLVATARGTVGIEMSYHGIPVAALYDNPYANFGFVHTCMDKASYFALLRGEERAKVDFDRDEICSFYYQAFLERFETVDRTPFDLLESFNGDTYSGRYLEFILSHADEIFTDRFVDAYERALT